MKWITDHIAIGNFKDAQSPPPEVEAILCLKPHCDCDARDEPYSIHVPLVDGGGNDSRDLALALTFLRDEVAAGRRVLVHCHAGRSRSVAIVARYLVEFEHHSRDDALAHIRARCEVALTPGITELLELPVE